GAGVFTGSIGSAGSIGSVSENGSDFAGSIVSSMNLGPVTVTTGNVLGSGVISAGMTLTGFSLPTAGKSFSGTLIAGRATPVTLASMAAGAFVNIANDTGTFTVNGADAGEIHLAKVTAFRVTGLLSAGASVNISKDAGSVTLTGGVALGALVLVDQNVT